MKIAYFNCFAGAAGDMILGALLDVGLPLKQLEADLASLHIEGFRLDVSRVLKHGILGTKVDVIVHDTKTHRSLEDIKHLIGQSGLPAGVQEQSIAIFTRLAEAEARVHGVKIEEIVFHEVGALDAIVDVVGAVTGLWRLGIEAVYASPLNVGGGFARSAHGVIPVPGPATLELLKGVPVYSRGAEKELLTPTGAAILTTCCRAFGEMPTLRVENSGYGAGSHDLDIPNLLGITIGESVETRDGNTDAADAARNSQQAPALMMEANIDNMNPEIYDYVMTGLLEAGAMDVFLQTIQMKKGRPAVTLCVLMRPEDEDRFCRQIFAETTTLGLRVYPVTKHMLPYEIITLKTSLGNARVKIARQDGKICNVAPEYEDCRRLAQEKKLPLKAVYDVVKAAADQITSK
jgi:uncharacterized protein (TIGR00299 family) protein